jgi:hypothetical protein
MNRLQAIQIVHTIVGSESIAEMVIDRLTDEGVLQLGYGNADIDAVINCFKEQFGTTSASKYDRYAAKRLAERHGTQVVCVAIQVLADMREEPYAPGVRSVQQLEQKWVNVVNFIRKQSQESEVIDV